MAGFGATPTRLLSFHTEDPDEFSEKIAPIAPGVHGEALAANGFGVRVRAWACGGAGVLEYAAKGGRAYFPEDRSYLAAGVTLHGATEFRQGPNSQVMSPGDVHVLRRGEPAELTPLESSQLVGINLDAALVEAHRAEPGGRQRTRDRWPLRVASTCSVKA